MVLQRLGIYRRSKAVRRETVALSRNQLVACMHGIQISMGDISSYTRHSNMQRVISTLLSAGLIIGLSACGSSGSGSASSSGGATDPTAPTMPTASPQTATVAATTSLAFDPGTVTIAPGGTVTFAFGSVGHTVVFDSQTNTPASITAVSVDTSITRTFTTAGTFTFHCTVHAGMTGKVIVADQITGTNTAPPPGYGGP